MIAILCKHCGWNIGYSKLEQFLVKWFWIYEIPTTGLLFTTKMDALLRSGFSRKFSNCSVTIQYSSVKIQKEKMKMIFQKQKEKKYFWFQKIKIYVYNSPIIEILFHTRIGTRLCRVVLTKFLNCDLLYFWLIEYENFKTKKTQNSANDTFKLLGHNWKHRHGFFKQKMLLCTISVWS